MGKFKPGIDSKAKVTVTLSTGETDFPAVVKILPDGSVNIKVRPDGRITPGTDAVITLSDGTRINGKLDLGGEFTSPRGTVAVG